CRSPRRGRRACGPCAAERAGGSTGSDRRPSAALLDVHEMAHLADHAHHGRRVLELVRLADPAEAERAQRAAVALRLADLATNLRQLQLRHRSPPPPPRCLTPLQESLSLPPASAQRCLTPRRQPERRAPRA